MINELEIKRLQDIRNTNDRSCELYILCMTVYVIDNEYTFEAKMFVPLLILPAERTEIHSQLNYAS